mgnify:FL=1|tara:strand:- start:3030 stop:3266 length:237 start_codon:yes stop_codon:yes gene_type:complete
MRKKQGKTKGATSFVSVSLGVLNETFREGALILVSRKFAETNGIQGERVATSTGSKQGREEMQSHAPIEFKSEDVSDF